MIEIIDALERSFSSSEIIEILNGFHFCQKELNDYAVKNMICPKCYEELVIHSWMEPRGEVFGFPVDEEMSEFQCEGCGWVDD